MKHATQLEKNSGFRWLVCFVGYRFIKTASGNSPTCARLRRASPLPKTCREQIGRPGLRRAEGWGNDVARSLCARCVTRKRLQAIRSRFVWSSETKCQNICGEAVIAGSERSYSLISARNGSANSLSFCCPTPAICANSLLVGGHTRAISRSVASEKMM